MNLPKLFSHSSSLRPGRATAAFTLPELFISMTLFLLLILGVISATLFGLRWFQISQSKLLASNGARESIGKMDDEIRSCTSAFVGSVSTNGIFSGRTNGELQIGSSLLIYPTTNITNYILYFWNPLDQSVRRTCISSGMTRVMAQTVTNTNIFQVQDVFGNVQTNNQNNRVIHCTLQFYTAAPNAPVPSAYTLDTAVTRRAL